MEILIYQIASFLFPFCSFTYQLVLTRTLMSHSNDDYLILGFANGLYLLGLAFGSYQSRKSKNVLQRLIGLELFLILFVQVLFLALPLSYALGTNRFSNMPFQSGFWLNLSYALAVFGPLVLGQISGQELPLLQKIWAEKLNRPSFSPTLALNYMGSLASGLVAVFVLDKFFTSMTSILIITSINLLLVMILLRRKWYFAIMSMIFTMGLFFTSDGAIQLLEKLPYMEIQSPVPVTWSEFYNQVKSQSLNIQFERTVTPYQQIDLIHKKDDFFAMYLNGQYQFDSRYEKKYHETLTEVLSSQLRSMPERILVLGAGDGLLVRSILKKYPTVQIDLIELDEEIIHLAKENSELVKLNEKSLSYPGLKITIDDAFHFLKTSHRQWDIVLADFPYPNTFEISKIYSVEFYKLINKSLTENGLLLFDYPLRDSANIISATLTRAGFEHYLGFVNTGEGFVLASRQPIGKPSLQDSNINVTSLPKPQDFFANSIFKPTLPFLL